MLSETWNVMCVSQENCVYETVVPPLDERDFEKTVTPIVQEYFEHADTNEVAVSVQETTCQWTSALKITTVATEHNFKARSKLTSLSTFRSCLQNWTWAPWRVRFPRWLCRWPWRPKPASGSSPPGCWQTCVGPFCPVATWKAPSTNYSRSCRTWSWIHLEPRRWAC